MSGLRILCLAMTLLVCVNSQDPTMICYNPTFSTRYFNTINEDNGTVTVDFTKELYVEVSDVTGLKIVHDFANLRSHAISKDSSGNFTCKTTTLRQDQVMYACLPPYAKLLSQVSGVFGYATSYKMPVQTWEVETSYDTVYRVTFVYYTTNRYLPVFLQEFGYHGTINAYMYLDPQVSISDKTIFQLPAACVTDDPHVSHVIVG